MNSNETQQSEDQIRRPRRFRLWKIPFFILGIVLIKSLVVMLLWNALVPGVFHGPVLDYVQALQLTVLVKLLTGFGGFRHGGFRGGHHHGLRSRWMSMSPEEREKFRQKLHERCGP